MNNATAEDTARLMLSELISKLGEDGSMVPGSHREDAPLKIIRQHLASLVIFELSVACQKIMEQANLAHEVAQKDSKDGMPWMADRHRERYDGLCEAAEILYIHVDDLINKMTPEQIDVYLVANGYDPVAIEQQAAVLREKMAVRLRQISHNIHL